ncbi:hypothetical protein GCM10010178_91530 [Lentzea flava]|uniref:Uncharacterized protein n=1 Tax=Lentzea flava TaxID=103732 RepID=A0ABQ2VJX9_9PSEU|nr:hypothetical protein GCM10010178_91530 [Lentzea flava]
MQAGPCDSAPRWTPCPTCGLHGWPDQHQAHISLARTRADPGAHRAAPALASASGGIYRCDSDSGLWHTTIMSRAEWRRLVQPIELTLPRPPYLPPRHRTAALPTYLTTIGQLLTDAITHAPPGLALPPRAALCARYRVPDRGYANSTPHTSATACSAATGSSTSPTDTAQHPHPRDQPSTHTEVWTTPDVAPSLSRHEGSVRACGVRKWRLVGRVGLEPTA